jgi:signal transduction histidine kinase
MVMQGVDARTTMSAFMLGLQETCHDMRQPVASVFALAAAALSEPELPQPARSYLEQIVEQAEWLADLIQQSLHAAAPGVPGGCRTDLLQVVRDAVAAECLTWPGDLRVAGAAEPVFTAVHAVLLRRMVANLLSNATRAAGPSGGVTAVVGRRRRSVTLTIEDTGPGFGKIERGLGLGLNAVSRFAGAYGGRLAYGSGPAGGARVSLSLPRTAGAVRGLRQHFT